MLSFNAQAAFSSGLQLSSDLDFPLLKAFIFIADFVSGNQCEYCVDIWTLSALSDANWRWKADNRLCAALLRTCVWIDCKSSLTVVTIVCIIVALLKKSWIELLIDLYVSVNSQVQYTHTAVHI